MGFVREEVGRRYPGGSVATLPGDEIVSEWPSENLIVWEQRPNPSDLWMVDLSDPESPKTEEYSRQRPTSTPS